MKMLGKALVVRSLVGVGKTVWVMQEGAKLTHTTIEANVDLYTLIGTYQGKALTAEEINEDLHFALGNIK